MKTDSKECILLEINFLLHFIGLSALDWGRRFPHCVVLTLPTLLDLCGCCEILTSLMCFSFHFQGYKDLTLLSPLRAREHPKEGRINRTINQAVCSKGTIFQ